MLLRPELEKFLYIKLMLISNEIISLLKSDNETFLINQKENNTTRARQVMMTFALLKFLFYPFQ